MPEGSAKVDNYGLLSACSPLQRSALSSHLRTESEIWSRLALCPLVSCLHPPQLGVFSQLAVSMVSWGISAIDNGSGCSFRYWLAIWIIPCDTVLIYLVYRCVRWWCHTWRSAALCCWAEGLWGAVFFISMSLFLLEHSTVAFTVCHTGLTYWHVVYIALSLFCSERTCTASCN